MNTRAPIPFTPLWHNDAKCIGPFWEFFSLKAGRVVRLVGDLLYYLWVLLESDPHYVQLCEQPLAIHVRVGRLWVKTQMDLWARDVRGVECFFAPVYRHHLAGPHAKKSALKRLGAQEAWAHSRAARFAIASDRMIWSQPQLLSNWAYLLRFLDARHQGQDVELGVRIRRAVAAGNGATLGEIRRLFHDVDPTIVETAAFAQLHSGALRADLASAPLSGRTNFTAL